MKQTILTAIATFFCFLFSFSANAQEETIEHKTPKWVSDQGYWVVETNKKTPKDAIVYFYSNNHVLVYKEEIKNQKLKMNRSKTLLRFKAALEESIAKYEAGTLGQQNILWAKLQQD